MATRQRLVYPERPGGFDPERLMVSAVSALVFAFFTVAGVYAIVLGITQGSGPAVIFGVFALVIMGTVGRSTLHVATQLEFSDGQLTWRSALPWYPPGRPSRVRSITWPSAARSRYVLIELTDGQKLRVVQRADLVDFVTSIRALDPAIDLGTAATGGPSRRVSRLSYPQPYAGRRPASPVVRVVSGMTALLFAVFAIALIVGLVLTAIGAQENFQTLRAKLAQVHLPSGYHLAAEHRTGTDCAHASCSIVQTWTWSAGGDRTARAACADVYRALTAAYSEADANSPIPAGAACDYYSLLESFFHPGEGKPSTECIVRPEETQPGGVMVILTASYGT